MENIKDKMTTIAGYLGAFAFIVGSVIASIASNGVKVPSFITIFVGACGAASVAIIGYYIDKSPNGKSKTAAQVESSNAPTGTVIKTLVLLIGLSFMFNFSQAQTFKYFWKSINQVEQPEQPAKSKLLKSINTPTETPTFIIKFDASVSGISYQYQDKEKGWAINYLDKIGIGASYQKITVVDGKNYANITIKALFELPTPTALTQKVGGCVGIFIWNNTVGFNVGYTVGQKWPYFGPAASYNF